jgi:hypothetical protein
VLLAPTGSLGSTLDILHTPATAGTPPQASGIVAPASAPTPTTGEAGNAGAQPATLINHVRDAAEGATAARAQATKSVGAAASVSPEGQGFDVGSPADPGAQSGVPVVFIGRLASPVVQSSEGEWPPVPDAPHFPNSIVPWLGNAVADSGAIASVSGAGFAAVLIAIFAVHAAFALARKVSMDGRVLQSLALTPVQPPG